MTNKDIEHLSGITRITNGRRDRLELLRDFFELSAIRISNSVDPTHFEERHNRALKTMEQYNEEELQQFGKYYLDLVSICTQNLSRGEYPDVLGRLYEQYGHIEPSSELTPHSIPEIMSYISLDAEGQMKRNGFVELADQCCGSAVMTLRAAQILARQGLNPSNDFISFSTDKNSRCINMAYIQLSLHGIPAVLSHADILTLEETDRWYTPMHLLGNWIWRRPMNHTTARNLHDERLKMITEPMYGALRSLQWGLCDEAKESE